MALGSPPKTKLPAKPTLEDPTPDKTVPGEAPLAKTPGAFTPPGSPFQILSEQAGLGTNLAGLRAQGVIAGGAAFTPTAPQAGATYWLPAGTPDPSTGQVTKAPTMIVYDGKQWRAMGSSEEAKAMMTAAPATGAIYNLGEAERPGVIRGTHAGYAGRGFGLSGTAERGVKRAVGAHEAKTAGDVEGLLSQALRDIYQTQVSGA